ncbi:ATP-dependent DNA helicase DDX11 [Teleopsis dalmanni]|uniref:ATP-dependent DNA helicase DDX11 n=1 Tax=Teleopsis dalmanni TaxID=139649 RepID=UPI0018CF14DF|nr:ATP-dependent DNA helicase DDX11 [Teleopsis dalmanni]
MFSPRTKLKTATEFDFPYQPYNIQQQLMEALFDVLEHKKIGIFESPTGTGKSLTLTCAALRWLESHENLVRQDLLARITEIENSIQRLNEESNKSVDWISIQYEGAQQRKELCELRKLGELLQKEEERLQEMRERHTLLRKNSKHLKQTHSSSLSTFDEAKSADVLDEDEVLLDDIIQDDEEVQEQESNDFPSVQIYFCSRTHSQLSQVVREIKKTAYGKRIRCVSLASRQQLCINPQVRKLTNVALMNERCTDMTKNSDKINTVSNAKMQKLSGTKGCSFKRVQMLHQLSDAALVDITDIEDLVNEGKSTHLCPYYAARAAAKDAQIIMLPYQMLLHHRTRVQSGINLRGAVVIIDEAHNLLDTISQLYSCEISLQQLTILQQQMTGYKMKFVKRFNTSNLLRINQLIFVVKRLIKLIKPNGDGTNSNRRTLRTYDVTSEGEFFNINLKELVQFCENNRLAQKLQGFAQRQNQEPQPSENKPPVKNSAALDILKKLQQEHAERQSKSQKRQNKTKEEDLKDNVVNDSNKPRIPVSVSTLRPFLSFIDSLTESADDGRVFIDYDANAKSGTLKYLLLNPGNHFETIINEARAIVIAGGTMQPTTELTEQLFNKCPTRVQQYFYDHVVSSDAVLPFVVANGPTGRQLCFNFTQRGNQDMMTELGMILQNICNVVPAGVVCFLPSYEYLDEVYAHFERNKVLASISQKKCIFREPRGTAAVGHTVEQLLVDYSNAIKEKHGALLFSVVGGKLSEGLNFADDLGRGVIVVGMPYPNRHSPELQERMKYLDITLKPGAGNEYYENLCMKAVNQCIGRSVRHIRDYACVYLLDERYSSERIQKKLPHWISRCLQTPSKFGLVQAATAKFFKTKSS